MGLWLIVDPLEIDKRCDYRHIFYNSRFKQTELMIGDIPTINDKYLHSALLLIIIIYLNRAVSYIHGRYTDFSLLLVFSVSAIG